MNKRSRTEVISSILEEVGRKRSSKIQLLRALGLSNTELDEYLVFILSKKLVREDQENGLYSITERGLHYLQVYHRTKASIEGYLDSAAPRRVVRDEL